MGAAELTAHADRILEVALAHHQCRGGKLLDVGDETACILVEINVEMPLGMKADRVSPNGVKVTEPVEICIGPDYPWIAPTFYLRDDFPRDLPHLQPGGLAARPRPCLVDGSHQEFFVQFGLEEGGIFHLIEQLALWLRRAAVGALIHAEQGWEPMLRYQLSDSIAFDSDAARAAVTRNGGSVVWASRYFRRGAMDAVLNGEASTLIDASTDVVPLRAGTEDKTFNARWRESYQTGNTVTAIIWPDKLPSGKPFVASSYLPETVQTLADLRERARQFGCERGFSAFLNNLHRSFAGTYLNAPIPVGIVFCARRPIPIAGLKSDIELVPYVIEIRAFDQWTDLFALGDNEPVAPAGHLDAVAPALMRRLSGSEPLPPIALLGCGSLGSKMALHLARSGQEIVSVSDNSILRPHNLARHGLLNEGLFEAKADALATELANFGVRPSAHKGDLVADLRLKALAEIIPRQTRTIINTTASLAVREAIVASPADFKRMRIFEAGLVGRGRAAFVLGEGVKRNPNCSDLMANIYAKLRPGERLHSLMFDPQEGLSQIQIGQGCGSMTMQMSDARLSSMTGGITEEIERSLVDADDDGLVILAECAPDSPATTWTWRKVKPFEVVEILGTDGWQLRIAADVADRIREEARAYKSVETGGIIIGAASARLKTLTVVDLMDAPPDSKRAPGLFVLGTAGLQAAIQTRHGDSGRTLIDLGTWHSHLMDEGPSPTDWSTARDLAAERAPPCVLLIVTPKRFFALQSAGVVTDA